MNEREIVNRLLLEPVCGCGHSVLVHVGGCLVRRCRCSWFVGVNDGLKALESWLGEHPWAAALPSPWGGLEE